MIKTNFRPLNPTESENANKTGPLAFSPDQSERSYRCTFTSLEAMSLPTPPLVTPTKGDLNRWIRTERSAVLEAAIREIVVSQAYRQCWMTTDTFVYHLNEGYDCREELEINAKMVQVAVNKCFPGSSSLVEGTVTFGIYVVQKRIEKKY